MAEDLEAEARKAVYEAGVIVDMLPPHVPSLRTLAEACDDHGVTRPYALTRALQELG